MPETEFTYSSEFTVRDYECDIQGVVNNANYQHYLEHARHEFLISKGISFAGLHEAGIDLIVTKVEIEYKYPLRSRDKFVVRINVHREGNVRVMFFQNIYRRPDEKLVARAKVETIATRKGRPVAPGDILMKLGLDDKPLR
ncbi:MAG: thioesterase family protein [Bacteroidales bacterium]|jgi:acyl-CoA thioester hydrolase